ncbi:MAG: hypothetical protein IPM12_05105 [Flavobacteriales bacterium]|nr:hypothetical protein [Flavobacteriales bacterium]
MRNALIRIAKVAGGMAVAHATLIGCKKPEVFPPEPAIEFKSFTQFGDSASLVIAFTDGDGDIGLSDSDNQPPFDTSSTYYHNLFIEYDTLENGTWRRVEFTLPLYYRVPVITPTGQNKTLEGEIAVALKPWPLIGYPTGWPADTVRFTITLVDRALHVSNAVESPQQRIVY